ncbi:hypothetical protein V1T76_19760 [Roseibium sp. FZY0029]|uniref:hypothetical protein n=1 Tax=Roseibium sp. FZY0029 TaxID=3116647 RepID=UPI002EA3810C|nr:hypothetical protein [Roseibium sp. FZY0029]
MIGLLFKALSQTFRQSILDILVVRRKLRTFSTIGNAPVSPGKLRRLTVWRLDAAAVFDLDQGQNFDKQF